VAYHDSSRIGAG